MYAIEARNICKRFGRLDALRGINLNVNPGETTILLGPNGAGKSTLLKILAGLYRPSSGTVRILGKDFITDPNGIRKDISFLGENYALYDNLTSMENLLFFGKLYGLDKHTVKKRTTYWLRRFNAMPYINRKIGELSRGTKQKMALCRAMINEPKLLLLDEPSAFLDPAASNELHRELKELSKNRTSIIYATQRVDELYKIGDNVLLIKNGKKVASGNADGIINRLKNVEVEIILSKKISDMALHHLKRRWKIRYGDSEKSLIFSVRNINTIPKVVQDVVSSKGEIISVLHLKESIDGLLGGNR